MWPKREGADLKALVNFSSQQSWEVGSNIIAIPAEYLWHGKIDWFARGRGGSQRQRWDCIQTHSASRQMPSSHTPNQPFPTHDFACLARCPHGGVSESLTLPCYPVCALSRKKRKKKKGFLGTSGLSAVCSFISINCKITGHCALFHWVNQTAENAVWAK